MSGEFSGELRERLTLLARATTRDDLGGANGAFTDGATLWAAIRPDGSGAEGAADTPGMAARWTATVRAPCAVASGDRLRWRGRTLRSRRLVADPAMPDRVILYLEEER